MEQVPQQYEEFSPQDGQQYATPYTPSNNQNINVVDKQLDVKSTIKSVRNQFLGIVGEDENGNDIIDPELQMMNERGTRACLLELSSSLASQVTLGYLTNDEVINMSIDFEQELILKLIRNKSDWQVKSAHYGIICDTLGRIFHVNLTRAIQGATHKGITQVSMVHEQVIQRHMPEMQQQQSRPSIWEQMGFKRRR